MNPSHTPRAAAHLRQGRLALQFRSMDILAQPTYLTAREAEVLMRIARGRTYAQIGEDLGVSLHTVASHVKNTYRKLGVRSGAAAVMRAVELRLFGNTY